ncbi:MAG: HAD family hydrolase [Lachnospiraceae bacterium]
MKYKFNSLILDVDGTLWDSTGIVASAWTRAIWDCGNIRINVTPDMLKNLFGKTMTVIADLLLPEVEEKKRYEIMEWCCRYEHEALEKDECNICYPNVIETIKELSKRLPVFIVSNCQSGYIELFLKKTNLKEYITDFECFGNTGKSKGENIKLIIERNHLENPVYVGDTTGDKESAAYGGIPFIYAAYGFGNVEGADYTINDFKELLINP